MPSKANSRATAADRLARRQRELELEEQREAIRVLLRQPLIPAEGETADAFRLIRRNADWLKQWFQRWPGWTLVIASDVARLRKHPSPRKDATRGLPEKGGTDRSLFTRHGYALLCLVLATLEGEQRQTTLQQVARKTEFAARADAELRELEFEYDARLLAHRRELVAIMRWLERIGVLARTDGDDKNYASGETDCLYRIDRAALTAVLCSIRGASTIAADTTDALIDRLNEVEMPESPEALNRDLQNLLVRRLLDDPVVYFDELTPREYEYFVNQGERLLREVSHVTGMIVERRAEGVAMLDPSGEWTDVGLPEAGTRGHSTLLIAEWLGGRLRDGGQPTITIARDELRTRVAELAGEYARYWRKESDTAEGVERVMNDAIDVLSSLGLVEVTRVGIEPRPAIARYRLADDVRRASGTEGRRPSAQDELFRDGDADELG